MWQKVKFGMASKQNTGILVMPVESIRNGLIITVEIQNTGVRLEYVVSRYLIQGMVRFAVFVRASLVIYNATETAHSPNAEQNLRRKTPVRMFFKNNTDGALHV